MMETMPDEDRKVLEEVLADEDGWTGGEIATTLNRAGYPATRSQVNHWRRRARAERLVKEANESKR
jgi:phenylpropionate dioxygenase-like ring-hydroxylating dioxygenase large terminal subunit